jgi:hypothetical protein
VNFAGLLGATKDLGARFSLIGLLPTASLALFVLALVSSGAPDDSPDIDSVVSKAEDLSAWEVALLFLALVVIGVISQPFQLSLVRLLEGYWGDSRVARLLASPGIALHRWRRRRLAARQVQRGERPSAEKVVDMEMAAAQLRRLYPPVRGVLPTKLGNVLRAAEYRAGTRYGLEATVVWPRLYPLLPVELAGILDDERDQLDLAVRFCVASAFATVISVSFLINQGWWLLVPGATLLLAWLSYRAAVAAAIAYGEGIETAFDLHRFDLLRALHLQLPVNRESEREANAHLSEFLVRGEFLVEGNPINFVYDHGVREEETGEKSPLPTGQPDDDARPRNALPASPTGEGTS